MNNSFNLIDFIKILWKWRKPVWIIMGLSVLGSIVITDPHIMPPYYESSSLIYPLNPGLSSSSNLFGENAQGFFGGSSDVDRILSIAGSVPLKSYIVRKFDLFKHYKIDSAKERYPMYAVLEELHQNSNFEKNDKGAVEITVLDHDRNIAAAMANEIVTKIDEINRTLLNESKRKILTIFESKLKEKEIEVDRLSDSIVALKQRFNLYSDIQDLPNQVKMMRSQMGQQYDAASERVKILEERKKGSIRELNNNTVLYEQYRATINSEVPTVYILEKAFPAEKKAKPIRWLAVVAALLISFVVCSLAVLLIERFKKIKGAFADA